MLRKSFYITHEQDEYLKMLDKLSESEHIRRAIDEYIDKIKGNNVSASQSTRKEENG